MLKVCDFCFKSFIGKPKRRFCSSSCFGKNRTPQLILRNKKRAKYPKIEGLTRQQVHYRFNKNSRLSQLKKDRELRKSLIRSLGGQCVNCGYFKDFRALQLDHKVGDGYLDRKRIGSKVYRYYISNIAEARINLQVLCANCNSIKCSKNLEYNRSRRVG